MLDLQISCEDSTEFPYSLHTTLPGTNILHNHSTFVKTENTKLKLKCRLYLDFISLSNNDLFSVPESNPGFHIAFSIDTLLKNSHTS